MSVSGLGAPPGQPASEAPVRAGAVPRTQAAPTRRVLATRGPGCFRPRLERGAGARRCSGPWRVRDQRWAPARRRGPPPAHPRRCRRRSRPGSCLPGPGVSCSARRARRAGRYLLLRRPARRRSSRAASGRPLGGEQLQLATHARRPVLGGEPPTVRRVARQGERARARRHRPRPTRRSGRPRQPSAATLACGPWFLRLGRRPARRESMGHGKAAPRTGIDQAWPDPLDLGGDRWAERAWAERATRDEGIDRQGGAMQSLPRDLERPLAIAPALTFVAGAGERPLRWGEGARRLLEPGRKRAGSSPARHGQEPAQGASRPAGRRPRRATPRVR